MAARDNNEYNVGLPGPMGKKIKEIIIQNINFIVFIDEDDRIEWSTEANYGEFSPDFGSIQNRVSYWESMSNKIFSRKEAFDYKCLLAEAYARIIDDQSFPMANDILDLTVDRIKKHGSEILKQNYILTAFFSTVFVCTGIIILVINEKNCVTLINLNPYEILLTSLFGAVGAFVFATFRLRNYMPDLAISKRVHRIDGVMRVFYGLVAGLIVAIGIHANAILGFISRQQSNLYLNLFLGIVAGASEVFVPNLIRQVENKGVTTHEIKTTDSTHQSAKGRQRGS